MDGAFSLQLWESGAGWLPTAWELCPGRPQPVRIHLTAIRQRMNSLDLLMEMSLGRTAKLVVKSKYFMHIVATALRGSPGKESTSSRLRDLCFWKPHELWSITSFSHPGNCALSSQLVLRKERRRNKKALVSRARVCAHVCFLVNVKVCDDSQRGPQFVP